MTDIQLESLRRYVADLASRDFGECYEPDDVAVLSDSELDQPGVLQSLGSVPQRFRKRLPSPKTVFTAYVVVRFTSGALTGEYQLPNIDQLFLHGRKVIVAALDDHAQRKLPVDPAEPIDSTPAAPSPRPNVPQGWSSLTLSTTTTPPPEAAQSS